MNPIIWTAISGLIGFLMAYKGYKKRSLSLDGAISAFLVGLLTFAASLRFGLILIFFFAASSAITNIGSKKKRKIEHDFKEGGQRTTVQVLANSMMGNLMSAVWLLKYGTQYSAYDGELGTSFTSDASALLLAAVVGHYACCCGDTWASELGSLSPLPPRLVLPPFRVVPPGTNGGVSTRGFIASAAGGVFIGFIASLPDTFAYLFTSNLTFAQYEESFFTLIVLGAFSGIAGSFIDSVLGATVQYSGLNEDRVVVSSPPPAGSTKKHVYISGVNILDNHMVNAVSAVLTSVLAIYACAVWRKIPLSSLMNI